MSSLLECFHCLQWGHWAQDCPLLVPPEDRKEHEQRLAEIKRRFDYEEIGPLAKRKMIEKENSLWKDRQKQLAAK